MKFYHITQGQRLRDLLYWIKKRKIWNTGFREEGVEMEEIKVYLYMNENMFWHSTLRMTRVLKSLCVILKKIKYRSSGNSFLLNRKVLRQHDTVL